MLKFIRSRENIPIIIAACIVAAVILTFLAPEEQTLGSSVKLVFMHAALMWVSFFMYTMSAVLSVIFLFNGKNNYFAWVGPMLWTGILILASTSLLGMITAELTWGGIAWREPRMLMLGEMLLASVLVVIINILLSNPKIKAIFYLALTAAVWWLLLTTEKIIHPGNPIFSSDVWAIKLFPLAVTFFLAIAAIQLARWLTKFS